jgi:hypothetical protein
MELLGPEGSGMVPFGDETLQIVTEVFRLPRNSLCFAVQETFVYARLNNLTNNMSESCTVTKNLSCA